MFNMKNTFRHDGHSSRGYGLQTVEKSVSSYGPSLGNGNIKRFFNIDKQLGKGAYSTVYRAINKHNNQPVALKIYRNSTVIMDKESLDMMMTEIYILKHIKHKNIVQYLASMKYTNNIFYLVIEYCPGQPLADRLLTVKYSEIEAAHIAMQLVDAIAYLHRVGVTHRDVKDRNVIIDSRNNIKLIDFGFSTYDGNAKMHDYCGTGVYMAPEVIKRDGTNINNMFVDSYYYLYPTDVWSTGVTIYYMVCGIKPFKDSSVSVRNRKIMKGNYPIPRGFSPLFLDLINSTMVINPNNRLTSNQLLHHRWLIQNSREYRNSSQSTKNAVVEQA